VNLAALFTLLKRPVTRWVGGVAIAAACLWASRCQGASSARADDAIKSADAAAKLSTHLTDSLNRIRAAETAALIDSLASRDSAIAVSQAATHHADSSAHGLSVVGPAKAPGETQIVGTPGISALSNGLGPADEPPGDTTKYAAIQRQGDPRLYTVPQFTVDAFNDQRRALADAQAAQAKSDGALRVALTTIGIDSSAIWQQIATIGSLRLGENAAKSRAGRDCSILAVFGCPPRKVVFAVSLIAGGIGGALLDHQLNHK
jgi:hypothetical protein